MSNFQREERYIVVKLSRIGSDQTDAIRDTLDHHQIPTEECVVVESDWPIYEETWENVQRLAESRPSIAKNVSRQFGELEAERDAALAHIEKLESVIETVESEWGPSHDPDGWVWQELNEIPDSPTASLVSHNRLVASAAFQAGFESSAEGFNGEYPEDAIKMRGFSYYLQNYLEKIERREDA